MGSLKIKGIVTFFVGRSGILKKFLFVEGGHTMISEDVISWNPGDIENLANCSEI